MSVTCPKCLNWSLSLQLWSQRSKQVGSCPGNTLQQWQRYLKLILGYLSCDVKPAFGPCMDRSLQCFSWKTATQMNISNCNICWLYVSVCIRICVGISRLCDTMTLKKKSALFGVCKDCGTSSIQFLWIKTQERQKWDADLNTSTTSLV